MKVVVLLSGGLDSSVLAAHLIEEGHEVLGLSVLYGQRHSQEIKAAADVVDVLELEPVLADLGSALQGVFDGADSSQVGGSEQAVPEGHYTDENMRQTIVPNRNMILLAVAGALAVSRGFEAVAYAAHAGDHPIYPDCRPEFASAMEQALELGCGISLLRPFVDLSKSEIVKRGAELGFPFEYTYSCYKGEDIHCGRCGTCVERKEAFRLAECDDPTQYIDEKFQVEAFRGEAGAGAEE